MRELYRLGFRNGKSYIGISRCASQRYKGHAKAAEKGSSLILSRAWRKYGPPKLKVLAVVENSDSLAIEQRAIAVFKTVNPLGYNMTLGGETSPMEIPEIAARMAAKLRGRKTGPHSTERRKRQSEGLRKAYAKLRAEQGFVRSPEVVEKTAIKNRGKPAWNKGQKGVVKVNMTKQEKLARSAKLWETRRTRENVTWAGRGKPGRKWTPEQRVAKAQEVCARFADPVERTKQSERITEFYSKNPEFGHSLSTAGANGKRGTVTSQETKQKMSTSMKLSWVSRKAQSELRV